MIRLARALSPVAVALALSALAAPAALSQSADELLPLGSTWTGEVAADGDPAVLGVLIPAGTTKAAALLKLAKGSALQPDFSLVQPDGTTLDGDALVAAGATVKASKKGLKVSNLPAATSGLYRFVVGGGEGSSGGFSLKVSGKPAKGIKAAGSIATQPEKDSFTIDVPENAYLTLKLKPSKSTPFGPTLDILPPSGAAIDYTSARSIGNDDSITVSSFLLPYFGRYTLRVGSAAGTGDYTLAVKVKAGAPAGDPSLPDADGGPDLILAPGAAAAFAGSGTTGAAFAWEQVSGPALTISGRTTATPSLTVPGPRAAYAWQCVTKNSSGYSAPDLVLLHVDRLPVSNAGSAITADVGATVTLDGSSSTDADPGDPTYFRWTQTSGPGATLDDPFAATTTFVPAAAGVYVFELTVSDGIAASGADRVVVAVGGTSAAADAGRPIVVTPQDTVFLSGARSRSASGGSPSTFAWTRVDGGAGTITLAGADGPVASFSAPKTDSTLRFRLVVDGSASAADEVTVRVSRLLLANATPVARAGARQSVATGAALALDGSASSDVGGTTLTHEWMQLSGEDAGLTGRTAASAAGTAASAAGIQRFLLLVHDGRKYSAPDFLQVVAGTPATPVAGAGADVSGNAGTTVTLASADSAAAPGRTLASRTWTQTAGRDLYDADAVDPLFDGGAASPQIVVPTTVSSLTQDRHLTFSLVVTDDLGASSPADTVTVNLLGLPPNAEPQVTVNASHAAVRPGTLVNLTSVANDADGDALSYAWTQVSGPPQSLGGALTSAASFTSTTASGNLVFRLTVNDGTGTANATAFDEVAVVLNQAPAVVLSADPVSAPQGNVITLSGTGTTDPEGEPLSYKWVELNPPGNNPVTLGDSTAQTTTFTVPAYSGSVTQRRRTFRLDVTDALGAGFVTSATVQFTPNAAPVLNAIIATGDRKIIYDNVDLETLSASPTTDGDGDALTFTWRIVSGPQKNNSYLSATSGASVNLKVPAPTGNTSGALIATGGIYTVGVVASDGAIQSGEVTIQVLAYPSFNTHVYSPVLSTGTCSTASCHGSGSGGGLRMDQGASTTITNLLNGRVTKNSYGNSSLHSQINNGVMPKSAAKLPEFRIEMVRNWIEPDMNGGASGLSSGAENN